MKLPAVPGRLGIAPLPRSRARACSGDSPQSSAPRLRPRPASASPPHQDLVEVSGPPAAPRLRPRPASRLAPAGSTTGNCPRSSAPEASPAPASASPRNTRLKESSTTRRPDASPAPASALPFNITCAGFWTLKRPRGFASASFGASLQVYFRADPALSQKSHRVFCAMAFKALVNAGRQVRKVYEIPAARLDRYGRKPRLARVSDRRMSHGK